jgi:DNA helicase-2/ATP-dependent DNA helicase PcrA
MERKIQLNSGQQQVVQTLSGPLLVLAGAGTGKTRVVTFRVAKLIETGISPERILAVTFTNKAAREMKERVGKKLGNRYETRPVISTFHSYCVRILRRRIGLLGFPNLFSIYNTGDQEAAARQVLRDIKASKGNIKPSDFLRRISRWKSAGVRAEDALNHLEDDASDYVMAIAYRRYQELLKTLGAIDFDDILLLTEEIFHRFPETLRAESNLFDHLLVDEYQDTNLCQYRIIKALALPHRNICVVGDDDQSIYSWRGAEVTHILNFKKDWPDAKVIRLETNYRSTKQILDWANRVIAFNRERHPKKLRALSEGAPPLFQMFKDSEEEAARVVGHIAKRIKTAGRKPSDFAVLFRTNEQVRAFEMEFRRSKIPYNVVGSQSFFDRKEVKDIMAYLKTIGRPQDDISLLRIINTPARGIGATTIRKMTASAVTTKKSLWETMKDLSSQGIEPRSAKAIEMFRSFIQAWRGRLHQSFTVENLTEFVEKTEYRREIEHLYPDPGDQQARWNAVGEVISAAGAFLKENPKGTLIDFLCETSLGEPAFDSEKEKQLGSNRVMLLTYHAAKGLEFHEVYMVGMEEGILPHKRSVAGMDESSIAEERRLCYVGMTRAQKRLVLSMALGRMKWGKMRPSLPSRFVYEATGQSDNPHYQKVIEKAAENQ